MSSLKVFLLNGVTFKLRCHVFALRGEYLIDFRYQRNSALRYEARDEQRRIATGRLESQVFNTRCPNPPSVIQFHPYETYIAVAGKDSFG